MCSGRLEEEARFDVCLVPSGRRDPSLLSPPAPAPSPAQSEGVAAADPLRRWGPSPSFAAPGLFSFFLLFLETGTKVSHPPSPKRPPTGLFERWDRWTQAPSFPAPPRPLTRGRAPDAVVERASFGRRLKSLRHGAGDALRGTRGRPRSAGRAGEGLGTKGPCGTSWSRSAGRE